MPSEQLVHTTHVLLPVRAFCALTTLRLVVQVKLAISSPKEGSLEDLEQLSLKEKLDVLRTNRDWKCNVRWEVREGLSTTTRRGRQI